MRAALVTAMAVAGAWARPPMSAAPVAADSAVPEPTEKTTFDLYVDNFNSQNTATFKGRAWVYDKDARPGGPLFFYSGNEGPLDSFWSNTGLPFEWAKAVGATVLFAEHRYYGQTLPFGADSFSKEHIGYLTITQVLQDYARIVSAFKTARKMEKAQVVVFGGSYGGMLAAWLRTKYPDVFQAAVSASSPIPQVYNQVDPQAFFNTITDVAHDADADCPDRVRAGFAEMYDLFKTDAGRAKVKAVFGLCSDLPAGEASLSHFMQYARNAFTTMAMCNYPYPTNFLAPLPAWPMKAACAAAKAAKTPMEGLAAAVALPYPEDEKRKCRDVDALFVECADQTGCGVGNDATAWDYQMCTNLVYEQFSNNKTDMFPPRKWTIDDLNAYCLKHYGVKPDLASNMVSWGGPDLQAPGVASQIVFSNGMLDPWHRGGYLSSQPGTPAVTIALGAHHLDLRPANKLDPPSVIEARKQEFAFITGWLGITPEAASTIYA